MVRQTRIPHTLPVLIAVMLAALLAGCSTMRTPSAPDFFVLFFVPGTTQLDPGAQMVVRQAAYKARAPKPMRIEIAVPPDAPGGLQLLEGRVTAIQNILSVEGADPKLYVRGAVAEQAASIPAAANRAEIRLIH